MDDRSAHRILDALADALPDLLARDDDRPPLWLSDRFAGQVAATRTRLASLVDPRRLAAAVDASSVSAFGDVDAPGRFEAAAHCLGRDPAAVAVAIRWLEAQRDRGLPSWTELLRHRVIAPLLDGPSRSSRTGATEASLWFG